MTSPYPLDVSLSVRSGPVAIWASQPVTGYFDPNRFPEHPLLSLQSGEASTVTVPIPTAEAALIVRPAHEAWPVAYLLTISMGEHTLLSVEAISYREGQHQGVATHTRTRLHSVKSIARIGAYKLTPGSFSPEERIIEFSPSLPAGAIFH